MVLPGLEPLLLKSSLHTSDRYADGCVVAALAGGGGGGLYSVYVSGGIEWRYLSCSVFTECSNGMADVRPTSYFTSKILVFLLKHC
jgi:hypothetical protein